jgi:hypothetical protein
VVLDVVLPQGIVGPDEASEEGMRDAYILGSEVREQVLVSVGRLPIDLT